MPDTSVSVVIEPLHVWIAFSVMFVVYVVFAVILIYHWRRYGFGAPLVRTAQILYFVISGLLVVAALVATVAYTYV